MGSDEGDLDRRVAEQVYPYIVSRVDEMDGRRVERPSPGRRVPAEHYGHITSGEFVELDPPRRVVYTSGLGAGPGVTSEPTATDYHTLQLQARYGHETSNETYTGLTDEGIEQHGQGWDQFLPGLARAAA